MRPSSAPSVQASSVRPSFLNHCFSCFCLSLGLNLSFLFFYSLFFFQPFEKTLCLILSFSFQRPLRVRPLKTRQNLRLLFLLRKEVIHPHVPVGIPCYDLTPVIDPAFDGSLLLGCATGFGHCRLPWFDGRCVQGPRTYSPRHADPRLLAIPTSWSRVADSNPNWDGLFGFRSRSLARCSL